MSVLEKILEKRGITEPLKARRKKVLNFPTLDKAVDDTIAELFMTADENVRIGIEYDVDVDGLFSGYILYNFLKRFGFKNVFCYINPLKQHGIVAETLEWVDKMDLDWFFIVDAGSGDSDEITSIVQNGTKVVVLDHHPYDKKPLPKGAWLVNISDYPELPKLSGCGVTYRYIEKIANLLDMDVKSYETFVGVTVISDMCSMLDEENRYYVKQAYDNYHSNPLFKQFPFYGSYRSFYAFGLIPYLNAMIRIGEESRALVIVNNLNSLARNKHLGRDKERVKALQEEKLERLRSISKHIKKKGFMLCLRKEKDEYDEDGNHEEFRTVNGLYANDLLQKYERSAFVMKQDKKTKRWSGSFRGLHFGKEVLKEWGFTAKGHDKACGVEISHEDLKRFASEFALDDNMVKKREKSDILVNVNELTHKDWIELAKFNEYAGTDVTDIIVEYRGGINNVVEEEYGERITTLYTADCEIKDFLNHDKDDLRGTPVLKSDGYQMIRV